MSNKQKMWLYSPSALPNPKVSEEIKAEVQAKAAELINETLKPTYIKPAPEDANFNYLVDIYAKWYRSYFYFCAKYASPGPNAISPFFELKFARMEYVRNDLFNLSFMRYTGQWIELYQNMSLSRCLAEIKVDGMFMP